MIGYLITIDMRIYIIGPTYPYRGGISHYNTLLCENLKKRHDLKSVSFKRLYPSFLFPGKYQKDFKSKINIKTDAEHLIDSINPLTWIHVFLSIKKEQPDILILQWWTPFFMPALTSSTRVLVGSEWPRTAMTALPYLSAISTTR